MNEEKLFQLLGAIVETNQQVLKQNETALKQNAELVSFLKERDANVAKFTELAVQCKGIELQNLTHEREAMDLQLAALAEFGIDRAKDIKERVGLNLVQHKTALLRAREDQEYAERAAAKRAEAQLTK